MKEAKQKKKMAVLAPVSPQLPHIFILLLLGTEDLLLGPLDLFCISISFPVAPLNFLPGEVEVDVTIKPVLAVEC